MDTAVEANVAPEKPNPAPVDPGKTFMALTFDLDGERFAISVSNVQEVIDPLQMTRVPNADAFAPGLINVRGAVVPVLNLHHRLGIDERERTGDTRYVVIEANILDERTHFAITADSVHEVLEISERDIRTAPELGMKWPPEYILGIAQRAHGMLIFLDTECIFRPEN